MNNNIARNLFWQELDRQLNTCDYFQRDFKSKNAMEGYYVRDGKKCWCKATWDGYSIDWYAKHPKEIEDIPTAFLVKEFKSFINFLKVNKWDENWYKPRERAVKLAKKLWSSYMFNLIFGK